jgi:hypothetical protein
MAQTKQDLSNAPSVDFCELVRNPALYEQKIMQVRASYIVTWQGSIFNKLDCYGKDVWVTLDPTSQKFTDSEVYKKFNSLTDTSLNIKRNSGYAIRVVEIVAIGRFEVVQLKNKFGNVSRRRGFSYLGAYDLQFTMFSIEEVYGFPSMYH